LSGLTPRCSQDEHCITCGDEATAMRVLRIDPAHGLAVCEDEGGSHRTVEIGLIDPVGTGDRVLVHADVALAALEEPS
jgi:hydrogenase maturation factor